MRVISEIVELEIRYESTDEYMSKNSFNLKRVKELLNNGYVLKGLEFDGETEFLTFEKTY